MSSGEAFFLSDEAIENILNQQIGEQIPAAPEERMRFFRERKAVCRMILSNVVSLQLSDSDVLSLWDSILNHKHKLSVQLGRPAGFRMAAYDHLCGEQKLIDTPIIVDSREYEQLISESQTDFKTGIFNARTLYRQIDQEIKRSRRYGFVFSLLLMDLDNFKKFNDTLGHLAGDILLEEIAAILKQNLRAIDIPARFGGDEFGILFPQTLRKNALDISRRIMRHVNQMVKSKFQSRIPVSMSGGIVMYPFNGDNTRTLLAEADKILYEAKARGKNRILAFNEKRQFPRFPCSLPVHFQIDGQAKDLAGEVRNISKQGLLISTTQATPLKDIIGRRISMDVSLSGRHHHVQANIAREIHQNKPSHFGCRFESDNPIYNNLFGTGNN